MLADYLIKGQPMRSRAIGFIFPVVTLTFGCGFLASEGGTNQAQKTRQAAVVGTFYPSEPDMLATMVDNFLAKAVIPVINDPIVALISPHAGYQFSGSVAAHAYALLKGRKVERVVVIAPSHFEAISGASVYDGDAYITPLGAIAVDREFAKRLASMHSKLSLSSRGHAPYRGQGEHSLEVQLPFLQRVLGEFKLVPVVMGEQNYEASRALGVALAKLIQGPETVIVASSDLSHYHPYDDAVRIDQKTLKAIEEWDYFNLSRNFERQIWEACGGGPIVAVMIAAERLGANRAQIIKYANSGDVTGDKGRVVGYAAVALVKGPAQEKKKARNFSLSREDKEALLKIARQSVESMVRTGKLLPVELPRSEALLRDRGAFVTLKERGDLRGCIGYIAPTKSLAETVRDVAALAAVRDERFRPVSQAELGQLEYEISVLSPLRRVTDAKEIKVGQHGLLIKKGDYEGLLLPQVPVEQRWDRATFLEQTCLKAGLPPQAWKDEDTDIFLFTAYVFGDHPLEEPALDERWGPPARQEQPRRLGPDSPP